MPLRKEIILRGKANILGGLFILIIKNAHVFILIYILLVQTAVQTPFSVSLLPTNIQIIAKDTTVQSTVQVLYAFFRMISPFPILIFFPIFASQFK